MTATAAGSRDHDAHTLMHKVHVVISLQTLTAGTLGEYMAPTKAKSTKADSTALQRT